MGEIPRTTTKTYVVEHLDPELGPWSALEYGSIAKESCAAGAKFMLTSVPESLQLPPELAALDSLHVEHRGVEEIFSSQKPRVCLLDPAATSELSPADGDAFDIFLYGGILGDDPPRDRTSELRKKGYAGRRLGPKQMTTDTAVRVTRMVVEDKAPLDQIEWVDYPELRLDKHETTEMPFRYVKAREGEPVMPEGMIELIKKDADKGLEDLL
ncbi:protein-arginine N-methyltransferase SFM1 [Coccidioides immitis RS]|uniref:DUF431 domain-containing protein n=3 Tax=Coccidioides immitis TaxID=5501 RepID=J3K9S9_COCIM|nr:protein-arginine N-methyltransferase SFM1 [Coccidioides immitis RS]EAS31701.3 hypothetical protein CIMG_07180 [Coccidioides immitis RS]KMP04360.1 hypothetical protein CIRG_04051 [Coccidioides immitis RMSCC 2394]KMU91027.1 hypothetical protein CIHG_08963 [Coccidioides immitis H538.4]TPX24447.1 hypothetical protein DIZ76_013794 [Coccidioides immitis]